MSSPKSVEGRLIKYGGKVYQIVKVHPLGTIDVKSSTGKHSRITGLPIDWWKAGIKPRHRYSKTTASGRPAKHILTNPREHRTPKRQEKFLSTITRSRRNPTLESGAQFDETDAAQVAREARTLSHL